MQDDNICWRCNKELEPPPPGEEMAMYCPECAVIMNELRTSMNKPQKQPFLKKKTVLLILFCVAVAANTTLLALYFPSVKGLFRSLKPMRTGTYATNSATDRCLSKLWKISKALNEGLDLDPAWLCPSSNQPYLIERTGSDVVASCPNPEFHGFDAVRVSKKSIVPEVK